MKIKEYFDSGYDKLKSERYSEAIVDFDKVIELDKNYERAYVHRAACKYRLKEYKGALKDFEIAMTLNPNDPMTYLNAGVTIYLKDTKTKNTLYLDKAIEMNTEGIEGAFFLRGMIRDDNLNLYELAIEDFTKALEKNYCPDYCYLKIADCYEKLEEFDKALLNYYKVIEVSSSQDFFLATAYNNIGHIKYNNGLYEEAIEYFLKAKDVYSEYEYIDEYIEFCKEALETIKS